MADLKRKQLPNLKISVDNTESTDESETEAEVQEEPTFLIHDVEVEHSDLSEEEAEELEKDDVEFNVRIGSFAKPKPKDRVENPDSTVNKERKTNRGHREMETKETTKVKNLPEAPLPVKEKRVYENRSGTFLTGIDVTSKEAQKKREERAKRFKIHPSEGEQRALDIASLYESLGLKEEDFGEDGSNEKGIRRDAIHLRGTDEMSTQDVFAYFSEFPANAVEWINDTSCNVVWLDKVTSIRAMLKLSRSVKEIETVQEEKREAEKRTKQHRRKKKEGRKGDGSPAADKKDKGGDKAAPSETAQGEGPAGQDGCEERMEVDDDELDLMAEGEVDGSTADNKAEEAKDDSHQKGEQASRSKKEVGKTSKAKREGPEKGAVSGDDDDSGSSSYSSSGSSSSGSDSSSDSGSSSDSSSSSSDSEDEAEEKKKSKTKGKRDADTGEVLSGKGQDGESKGGRNIPWPSGRWRLGLHCAKARFLFMRLATLDDQKEFGAEKKSQYYRKYGNPNYGGMKGLISSSRKRQIRFAKLDKELKSQGPDAREAIDHKRAARQQQQLGVDVDTQAREDGELSSDDSDGGQASGRMEEPRGGRATDLRQRLTRDSGVSSAASRVDKESSLDRVQVRKRPVAEVDDGEEDEMDLDAELEHLLREPPKKQRFTMRMHADEEEEKLKARRTKTGLLTVVAGDKGSVVVSRLAGRLGNRVQAAGMKDTGWQKEDRGRQGWGGGGGAHFPNSEDEEEDESREEEEAVEEVEEEDDFARELASYRALRNLPPPTKTKRLPAPKVSAMRGRASSPEEEEEDELVVADSGTSDLRSRLGVKKPAKQNFASIRIEVLDDDEDE